MASDVTAVENRTRKARGIALLSAVYGELSQNLSAAEITTAELLEAAQKLIELSKRDYVTNTHPHGQTHEGYYSYDLCKAFSTYQGRILENEIVTRDDEPVCAPYGYRLKRLLEGRQEDMLLEDVYA